MAVFGMTIDPRISLGLLAFSITATLLANWIVAGLGKPEFPRVLSSAFILSFLLNLVWILLMFVAGVIAARYIERVASVAIGYLLFGVLALLFSLLRAHLQRQLEDQMSERTRLGMPYLPRELVHTLTYLLFATVLYLSLSWFLRRSVELILFIPLWLGALLPDLDRPDSPLGRLLPFTSRRLEARFGHRQEWHTAVAAAFVALISAPLIPIVGFPAWYLISVGFASHLVLDLLTPQGIMLFWPIARTRYSIFGGLIASPGADAEGKLAAALTIAAAALLLVVEIGPAPPATAPMPSYEQTVERYYSMRGNNLVFANIAGTWQATGQPVNGRFEILNASGDSFIMLDRYTGKVFTAGQGADDNLYLNRISLQTGPSVSVKPVEIHLQSQRLAEALPALYEMQREAGLEHIYISGDVVIPQWSEGHGTNLQLDYAQTSLRRIQSLGDRHYRLRYLMASDLIELANLEVENADLVFVATYASPATGPTVTPLPSPKPASEPGT